MGGKKSKRYFFSFCKYNFVRLGGGQHKSIFYILLLPKVIEILQPTVE